MTITGKTENKHSRLKLLRFLLLALVIAVCYNLFAGRYGFISISTTRSKLAALQQAEKEYIALLVDLETKIERLKSDSLYLEKLVRTKYRFGKPGEKVIEF